MLLDAVPVVSLLTVFSVIKPLFLNVLNYIIIGNPEKKYDYLAEAGKNYYFLNKGFPVN